MKKKVNLGLSLIENGKEVVLTVTNDGKRVLTFENGDAPAVRVVGFNQPTLTREQFLAFAHREAYDYENGAIGVLEHYVHSKDQDIYKHLLELRKTMRKLVKAVESANAASSVARELALPQEGVQRDGPASDQSAT